ncbi:rhodanese-like domain-containing protein [Virgibacillus alimentarius]|uniref:Rhodanese-related sulfurtransferase n=1 Tax=Virgibacillus alimentarius TaxID=698769 RepID=A0ABS4S6Z2_9BACI|nr:MULTISPECIES: rhodanese-like domain-containing protein [Virgibacillus]MBP2257271.1 rhodanese-related sulfurtransferase [Virgibacillus alimentarius]HLR67834.1 rhodanese-like domain-containing protein [Virgibacillus sp.]
MENINEITPNKLQELKETNQGIEIIDVREDEEVAQGMIEGAKHIRLDKIPEEMKDLDKSKHYVLVCRSGRRSMNAALYLNENGYKVSNLVGGMLDWDGEIII